MVQFFQMISIQSVLFLYLLTGYACFKWKLFDEVSQKKFTDFLIYLALPATVIRSFDIELTSDILAEGVLALAIATGACVLSVILCKVAFTWCKDEDQVKVMKYGTMVSNSGFAGLPVIQEIYGAYGVYLTSLYIIPTRILMWSAGIGLFTSTSRKEQMKSVLCNPGIIAVEIGFVMMGFGLHLPDQLDAALAGFGGCATPLAFFIVGMILAQVDCRTLFSIPVVFVSVIRLFVIPLTLLVVLRWIGVDPMIISIAVILSGMPVGSTTPILALKYGLDPSFAARCVFVSTTSSLVTVPILTLFL